MAGIKRILIACECSGVVREAFKLKGWDAWSCDILPSDIEGQHYQCDVKEILNQHWDMIIAHPPCTFFANTGARWFNDHRYPNRYKDRDKALEFFMLFANHPCEKIAIENPIGSLSRLYRKPDQIIHPYYFGENISKATCLWLKGLPKLKPTNIVEVEYMTTSTGKKFSKWYWESSILPLKQRAKFRSKTFQGIANAMAEQWG